MARRVDHTPAELRNLITEAAKNLIAAEGLAAVSTREIARRVGYTPGTLYQHFKDLDDILLHVGANTMQGLVAAMSAVSASENASGGKAPPGDRLHAYADVYAAYVNDNRNLWRALFQRTRPIGAAPIPDWYQTQIEALLNLVQDCFECMDCQPQRNTSREAAEMLWASIHAVCTLKSDDQLGLVMQRDASVVIRDLVDIHVAAYTNQRRRS